MEIEKEFNLIYYHRVTGEMVRVKKVTRNDCVIYDPETKTRLPLSKWALDKSYEACKTNQKRQRKVRLNFKNWDKNKNGGQ